jgi:hypothetical protein
MSSSWAGAVPDGCEVDDHGDVLVAAPGVPPDVLIDAENLDAVEPVRSSIRTRLPSARTASLAVFPGDPESFSDTSDGQVLAHDAFEHPPQTTPRELRPRLGSQAGVLAPHMPAAGAPMATDRDHQRGRPPTQRLVRQTPGHCVARRSLAPAATTPPHPTRRARRRDGPRQHGPARTAARSPRDRARRVGRTRSDQGRQSPPQG